MVAAPLTPEQTAIVKATAPVLKEYGTTITTVFYSNMIDAHPELKNIFSMTSKVTGRQPRALAAAVLAYATYIDDLGKLSHAVERIAHKHVSLQVTPAQYDIVGKYLIEAIGQVLGDAATPAIVDAWKAAYAALASVFIHREAEMYAEARAHRWVGWRKFRVIRKVPETTGITSFYLAPSDGVVPLPRFLPGQYVSLQLFVPQLGHLQSRQYSLSEAPTDEAAYYRISVKREVGDVVDAEGRHNPPGLISNMLHDVVQVGDEVELSHPQGEFAVDPRDETRSGVPAVLISAGVGATPLLSILGSLLEADDASRPTGAARRPVSWIHASRSVDTVPFADVVRRACRENENVSAHIFLSGTDPAVPAAAAASAVAPVAGDEAAAKAAIEAKDKYEALQARLDLAKLDPQRDLYVDDARAEYYICGPEPFMIEIRKALVGLGVDKQRIHLELFATGDVPDDE